jgi:hypothetical protein
MLAPANSSVMHKAHIRKFSVGNMAQTCTEIYCTEVQVLGAEVDLSVRGSFGGGTLCYERFGCETNSGSRGSETPGHAADWVFKGKLYVNPRAGLEAAEQVYLPKVSVLQLGQNLQAKQCLKTYPVGLRNHWLCR